MELGKEVRASRFENDFHKAMVNLYFTYKWYEDVLKEYFLEHDLLAQHFNVLMILKGKHPEAISPKDIREVMLDKGRDITRLVDKLVMKGLVNRELDPNNRRKMNISLTEDGLQITYKINKGLMKKIQELNNLTAEESQLLSTILDKLRAQDTKS